MEMREMSELDIAVFCANPEEYHAPNLWNIAYERQKLLETGKTKDLPT